MASLRQSSVDPEGAPPLPAAFRLRPAEPIDVPALMLLKHKMLMEERAEISVQGTALDWLHQGFGPAPTYTAHVVENEAAIVVGMVIFNERRIAGWPRPSLYVQDLYVEPEHRRQGIGRALIAQVARDARDRNAAYVELNVREENPARRLYHRTGFEMVPNCLVYVLGGQTLLDLANSAAELLALAGM
jgi:ribosomal protein S18 acetylase RimI-like enzyme